MKLLLVIDMQNDFVTDALGTPEAVEILPNVVARLEKAKEEKETVIFTRDTHHENYMETQEGRNLPVPHCIEGTKGWEIVDALTPFTKDCMIIDKPTFGSSKLAEVLSKLDAEEPIEKITLIGLCTDICVISNAMISKATLPEVLIVIEEACCAGVSVESHKRALEAMQVCQMQVV